MSDSEFEIDELIKRLDEVESLSEGDYVPNPQNTYEKIKTAKHSWTAEERRVLKVLMEEFTNANSDKVTIFNALYRASITKYAMASQYSEMKHAGFPAERKTTCLVQTDPKDPETSSCTARRLLLQATASPLGIRLFEKRGNITSQYQMIKETVNNDRISQKDSLESNNMCDLLSTPPSKSLKGHALLTPPSSRIERAASSRKRSFECLNSENEIESDNHNSSPSPSALVNHRLPIRQTSRRIARINRGPVPKPCYKKDITPQPLKKVRMRRVHKHQRMQTQLRRDVPPPRPITAPVPISRLAFRGFSERSQGVNSIHEFVAGAFVNAEYILECPDVKDPVYVSEATRHVGLDTSRPTPFISLSKNPIRSIITAFRMGRKSKSQGCLAVIDTFILHSQGILQASKNLDLNPPNVKYDSAGEYLVWGRIPKDAILHVISTDGLLESRPRNLHDDDVLLLKEMAAAWRGWYIRSLIYHKQFLFTFDTGYAVGVLLKTLRIPSKLIELGVSIAIEEWRIRDADQLPWKRHQNFVEGLFAGLKEAGSTNLHIINIQNERRTSTSSTPSFSTFVTSLQDASLESDNSASSPPNCRKLTEMNEKVARLVGNQGSREAEKCGAEAPSPTNDPLFSLQSSYEQEMEWEMPTSTQRETSEQRLRGRLIEEVVAKLDGFLSADSQARRAYLGL